jgi:hypothetical protein
MDKQIETCRSLQNAGGCSGTHNFLPVVIYISNNMNLRVGQKLQL